MVDTRSNLVCRVWLFVGSPVVNRAANFNNKVLGSILTFPLTFNLCID